MWVYIESVTAGLRSIHDSACVTSGESRCRSAFTAHRMQVEYFQLNDAVVMNELHLDVCLSTSLTAFIKHIGP